MSRLHPVVCLAALTASLPAQDPATEASEQPKKTVAIPSDSEGIEILELTLLEALRLGRVGNLSLRAAELAPLRNAQDVLVEEAFFEPEFFGNFNAGRSVSPTRNVFQPSITRRTLNGSLGIRQNLVTGGIYELSFQPFRTKQTTSVQGFPTKQYTQSFTATITQPLLRGMGMDYALSREEQAQAAQAAGAAQFERTKQDTLLQIVVAYWELVFARGNYRVVHEALDLAKEQLRITNERIRVRDLAERERVSDEAEVARRDEELIRAENEIRTREDELRGLLFDDSDGRLWERTLRPTSPIEGAFDAPATEWRDAARYALQARPDLAAARADVRAAELRWSQARSDRLPNLDLVGNYTTTGVDDSSGDAFGDAVTADFPDWSVGIQFSFPIGNTAAEARENQAAIAVEEAKRSLYAAELTVTREVREQLRSLKTLAASIGASREAVRLAEVTLDTEREKLRVGKGTLFQIQQRNQELLDARQRLLRNQLDYRTAEWRLRYVKGVLFAPGEARRSTERE